MKDGTLKLAISDIVLSGHNVREDVGNTEELADSIRNHGLLQPLVVTQEPDGRYVLLCGHRRLAACRSIGFDPVPVVVRDVAPADRFELMVVENVQRRNLSPLEAGRAFRRIIESTKITRFELAKRLGVSAPFVGDRLNLLELPNEIQRRVHRGDLGLSAALDPYRKKRGPRGKKDDPRSADEKWADHHITWVLRYLQGGAVAADVLEDVAHLRNVINALLGDQSSIGGGSTEGLKIPVFVVVGIHTGGNEAPEVSVEPSIEKASRVRLEWQASDRFRKVVVHPTYVNSGSIQAKAVA